MFILFPETSFLAAVHACMNSFSVIPGHLMILFCFLCCQLDGSGDGEPGVLMTAQTITSESLCTTTTTHITKVLSETPTHWHTDPLRFFFSIMWILVFHKAPLCVCCRCWRVAYQKPGLRNVSSLLATVTSTMMRSVSQSVILICTSGFWMMARFILGCVKGSLSVYVNPRCKFFTLFSKWKPLDTL